MTIPSLAGFLRPRDDLGDARHLEIGRGRLGLVLEVMQVLVAALAPVLRSRHPGRRWPRSCTGARAAQLDGLQLMGLQLMGRTRGDMEVLRAAAAYETACPHMTARPADPV